MTTPESGPASPDELTVDDVRIDGSAQPRLLLSGSYNRSGTSNISGSHAPAPTLVSLVGTRQRLTSELVVADGTWQASVPLLVSRWQSPPLAPRSGAYRLHVETEHGVASVRVAATLPAVTLVENVARIAVRQSAGSPGRRWWSISPHR